MKEATISLTKAQGEWLLTISDQGEGFETNHVSRRQGLDSIRKRAKELGGQALLLAAPGSGTTWEIRFPDKRGNGMRILLADDHHVVRKGLAYF